MKNSSAFRRMQGLSLIELMIAVVLGSLVVAAVGNVYLSSTQTYRTQEGMARMQEGARFAFETMTYDVRMAGFSGCRSRTSVNVLDGSSWYNNLFSQPLVGYETGSAPAVVSASVVAGDSLQVLRADNSSEFKVSSHNPTAAQFGVVGTHDLQQGEILVVTDCSHSATFQMTNPTTNNVVHNTGNATAPGNCTKGFGETTPGSGVPDCSSTNGVAYTFPPGSSLLRLSGNIYYIGNNPNNEPSLYRLRLTTSGANAGTVAEELVEGVEDMQITYGEDTTQATLPGCPDDNCSVDAYVPANAVTNWKRVVSARITLTMRTADRLSTETGGADRRIRRTFTTTVALRNRL